MPVEVLPGGNVRVYDDEGRFVAGYGSAQAKAMGLVEPSAKDVHRDTSNQLRQTVARGDGGTIEINGEEHVIETTQQERDAAAAAQEALASLDSIAPMVKSGLLDADAVRSFAASSVERTYADQRTTRKAAKDVEHLVRGFRGGQIDLGQAAGVRESLIREYGQNVLIQIPLWREIEGTDGEYRRQIEESISTFEEKNGVPGRWDDRSGQVVPDETIQIAQGRQATIKDAATKPVREYATERFKAIKPDRPKVKDYTDSFGNVNKTEFERAERAYYDFIRRELPDLFGDELSPQQRQDVEARLPLPSSAGAQQAAQAQPAAKPVVMNSTPMTPQQVLAIVNADPSKAGIYKLTDGRHVKVRPDR